MRKNGFLRSAFILAGVFTCFAGCQYTPFPGAAKKDFRDNDRPLTNHQIADVKLSMAHSLELQGKTEPALETYRDAVEKDPRRSTGHWRMAVICDRKGNSAESEPLYRRALKLDPKNPEIHCDYGYSLYLQRRWAESEASLRQALVLKPKHLRAHNNLGLVLAQTESSDEALAEFRNAGCNDADAHNNLAFVMTLNRHWEEARKHYELALDANPDSPVAKTGLENLNSMVAKLESAPGSKVVSLAGYERLEDKIPATEKNRANSVVKPAVDHTESFGPKFHD
jgi:Tfp pilus assembly protein PilF